MRYIQYINICDQRSGISGHHHKYIFIIKVPENVSIIKFRLWVDPICPPAPIGPGMMLPCHVLYYIVHPSHVFYNAMSEKLWFLLYVSIYSTYINII